MIEHADGEIGLALEPLGERAQDHALASARIALDQGKAAFLHMDVLDAPEEVVDLRRQIEGSAG